MSNFIISDGTGTGKNAKVNSNNRLLTQSSNETDLVRVSREEEEAYTFTSDFIAISSVDTETGIFYIKNLHTTKGFCISSIKTSGILAQKWKLYKGVSTGTLVSGGTSVTAQNLNLTSNRMALATVQKGVDGSTITDGTMMEQWIGAPGSELEEFHGAVILGLNDVIAITVEVPVACDVSLRIIGYFGGM